MNFKDTVQITFEIIVILASLGVVMALIKKAYTVIKNGLLYFSNVGKRLTALEKKVNRRTTKTKIKRNGKR